MSKNIYLSIQSGDYAAVKNLIINSSDVNPVNPDGSDSPLLAAIKSKNIKIVELLISNKADVNYVNKYGDTPLLATIRQKNHTATKMLISNKADVNYVNKHGDTPLLSAIKYKNSTATEMLINNKADVNYFDKYGNTPLSEAIELNNTEIVKLLIDNGASFKVEGGIGRFLFRAISLNNTEMVKLLIDNGANLEAKNDYNDTPLFLAIKQKNNAIAELLINNGANVKAKDGNGTTILAYATQHGCYEIVNFWHKYNTQHQNGKPIISDNDITVGYNLHLAAKLGKYDIVEALIANKADVNAIGSYINNTPLFEAIKSNNIEITKLLIDNGANLEIKDGFNDTPLFEAIKSNNIEIVKLLIDHGANIETKNGYNNTPLVFAIKSNNIEMVKLLIDHGANIEAEDTLGNTPLPAAIKSNNTEMVKLVIQKMVHDLHTKNNFSTISKMIMSNSIQQLVSENIKIDLPEKLVIYNNDSYSKQSFENEQYYQHGNPITLNNNNISVGYNIHLPKNDVKGVIVKIYGGGNCRDIIVEKIMYQPSDSLHPLDNYLLLNGIAVVTLNLVDLLKLNSAQNQWVMSEDLHEEVHTSINEFYKIIRYQPESLHPTLKCLKGKKLFLSGNSFGGENTERHAEKYLNTYDGYISFDGALSIDTMAKSDLIEVRGISRVTEESKSKAKKYLEPQNTKADSHPHLIIQNLNDHNANAMVAIDYYKHAKKAGKNIQVLFNNKGDNDGSIINTGHSNPTNKMDFDIMSKRLLSFIKDEDHESQKLTDLRVHQAKLYADLSYRGADLIEKFISAAYRIFQSNPDAQGIVDRFKNSEKEQNDSWNQYYKPLYVVMHHLHKAKANDSLLKLTIDNTMKLSDESIEKAISLSFPDFIEFLSIKHSIPITGIKFEDMQNKEVLIKEYRSWISDPSTEITTKLYLLKNIYLANPEKTDFMEMRQSSFDLKDAKSALIKELSNEYNEILSVWRTDIISIINPEITEDHIDPTSPIDYSLIPDLMGDTVQ